MSRAELSGINMAKSIIEMVELMYQKNTQKNFYKGLLRGLEFKIKELLEADNEEEKELVDNITRIRRNS